MHMPEETAAAREKREKAEQEAQAKATAEAIEHHKTMLTAIAYVTAKTGKIPKKGFNNHFGYSYVTKDDIVEYLKPLMAEAGLIIIPQHVKTERSDEDQKGYRDLVVTWNMLLVHAPTGASMTVPWESESMDNQDKGFAKAATSAMKQFVQALFDIPSGDLDTEHDAHSGQTREGGERAPSTRSSGGRVSVKDLLQYKADHNISTAGYDWVITQPQVGAKAGTMLKDLPREKLPAVMKGFEFYVNERDNRRDPETGEPLTGAPTSDGDPQASYDDPAPREPTPDDDIPF